MVLVKATKKGIYRQAFRYPNDVFEVGADEVEPWMQEVGAAPASAPEGDVVPLSRLTDEQARNAQPLAHQAKKGAKSKG